MAGHNKWTQIKRQKAVVDAKKSKLFSLLARQITMEAKAANGDAGSPGLKKALEKARSANMPNDNIERAISRASGQNAETFEEILYEAYGPGGAAIIIEGITDNKNRSTQEIKHLLATHGGSLAGHNAALWAFHKTDDGWQANAPTPIAPADEADLGALLADLAAHNDVRRVSCNIQTTIA